MKKCLIDGCQLNAGPGMRGLCPQCLGRAKQAVAAGRATWDDLARMGLCEPEEAANPFDRALARAVKARQEGA